MRLKGILRYCVLLSLAIAEDIPDADIGSTGTVAKVTAGSNTRKALTGRLYTYGNFDWQRPDPGLSSPASRTGLLSERSAQVSLNGEMLWKPSDAFTVKLDGKLGWSTEFPTNTAFFKEGARDTVSLQEAFVEWYPHEVVSLLIGKYRRVFSPGLFANPMDRHNANPAMPGAQMVREGNWLAQVTLHGKTPSVALSQFSVDAAWLPFFYRDDFGLPTTTNTFSQLKVGPLGALRLTNGVSNWEADDMGGFLRFYGNMWKSDVNLVVYRADRDWQLGLSFSRPFGSWFELHGEGLGYQRKHVNGETGGLWLDGLVGFRLEPTQDIGFTAEWIHFDDHPVAFPGTNLAADRIAFLSSVLFPWDRKGNPAMPLRDYVALNLSIRNIIQDTLDFTVNGQISLAEPEANVLARVDVRIGDHARVALMGGGGFGEPTGYIRTLAPFLWKIGAELMIGI